MLSQSFFIHFLSCSILSFHILLVGCTSQQTDSNSSNSAPISSIPQREKNDNNELTFTGFATPSGNIYCALVGTQQDELRCEIQSMLNPIPPQSEDSSCEFDWGAGFLLPRSSKPEILCISDTIAGSGRTLEYGNNWNHSGFNCKSETIGLTCTNANQQGFFLSRENWKTF